MTERLPRLAVGALAVVTACVLLGIAWSVEAAVWTLAALCWIAAALRPRLGPDSALAVRGVRADVAILACFGLALAFLAGVAALG